MADVELVEPAEMSVAPLEQHGRRRGTARLWSAAVLGAAAVAIVTSGPNAPQTIPPWPEGSTLAQDYVLALESVGVDADQPEDKHGTLDALGLSAGAMRRYENVGGLAVWSGESRYGTKCLLVAHPVQGLREGIGAEGCSPKGLDTIAELTSFPGGTFPPGVLAGLPYRSVIRFVLEGDHVNVFVFVFGRAADPAASEQ